MPKYEEYIKPPYCSVPDSIAAKLEGHCHGCKRLADDNTDECGEMFLKMLVETLELENPTAKNKQVICSAADDIATLLNDNCATCPKAKDHKRTTCLSAYNEAFSKVFASFKEASTSR